ncbi:MAG: hypothetical protein VW008_02235 [Aquiluna sp.]
MKKLTALVPILVLSGCMGAPSEPELQFDSIALGDTGSVATAQPSSSAAAAEEPQASQEPSASPSESESSSDEYAQDRYAEIDIEDQSGDGVMVQIEEIRISGSNSFLVIYNTSGLVLASALVTPQSQPVTIKLQVPITKSQELEAVLYLDDGDGVFDLNKDFPILDDEQELVHEDFYYRVNG